MSDFDFDVGYIDDMDDAMEQKAQDNDEHSETHVNLAENIKEVEQQDHPHGGRRSDGRDHSTNNTIVSGASAAVNKTDETYHHHDDAPP